MTKSYTLNGYYCMSAS